MAADPYRALVVLACVVAVAVGGVALPATEYGSVPGSDVDVAESSDPLEGGVFPGVTEDGTPAEGGTTQSAGSTATATPTPTATDDGTQSDGSSSPTPTESPTPTTSPPDDRQGLLGALGGGVFLVLAVAIFVIPLGIVGRLLLRRRYPDSTGFGALPRVLPDLGIPNPLRAISARTTAATLSLPSATARLGHAIQGAVVGTGSALGSAAGALGGAARMQASAFGALASALGGVSLGFSASLSGLTPQFGRDDLRDVAPGDSGSGGGAAGDGDDGPARLSVADAWAELRRLVSVPNVSARTPAEIARAAIDQGLPRGPVMRLTDAFRDVTYGRADPDGLRETAAMALQSLRDGAGGED